MTEMPSFYTPSTSDRISPPAPAAMNELMNRYSSARSTATFKGGFPRKYRNLVQQGIDRVRLEYYRYEVTFGLYVMTPSEKFVANTFVLVVLSLLAWALFYFPSLLYAKVFRLLWLLTGQSGEQMGATLGILVPTPNVGITPFASGLRFVAIVECLRYTRAARSRV